MTHTRVKVIRLPRVRLVTTAVLFCLLTAGKFLWPAETQQVREAILPVLAKDADITDAMQKLGERLAGGQAAETAQTETETETVITAAAGIWRPAASNAVPISFTRERPERMTSLDAQTEPETEEPYAEAVAAFFASQGEFASLEPPEAVSYAAPELPFSYVSPVAGYSSSGFGYRLHPIHGEVAFHYGTDFAANMGDDVRAFADGTVYAIGENPEGFGLYVMIDHGDGWLTLYGHCSRLLVSSGTVSKGQTIALVGDTGLATGPHLHFELHHDGVYYNPEFYLYDL